MCSLVILQKYSELGSSVGIATDYGLDSPESNPGADEIFSLSRPVLSLYLFFYMSILLFSCLAAL